MKLIIANVLMGVLLLLFSLLTWEQSRVGLYISLIWISVGFFLLAVEEYKELREDNTYDN